MMLDQARMNIFVVGQFFEWYNVRGGMERKL